MKVKNRNLIELILQSLTLILLFIDGSITIEIWYHETSYITSKKATYLSSFFQRSIDNRAIIGFLTIALVIAGVVLFVMQYIGKGEKRNSKYAAYIPIAELVLYSISTLIMTGSEMYGSMEYREYPGFLFYVCCVLMLVLALISVIGYLKAAKEGIEEEVVKVKVITNDSSNAEELIKYKQLLDMGIITQEEFDAKKKQLLGL